ncbi:MAG: hydrolase, partial [bacterium]|nr:hydrolase [bacterium]
MNLTSFETFYEEKRPFFLEGNEIFDFGLDGDIPYYSRRIGSAPFFPSSWEAYEISEIPQRTTILGAAKLTGRSKNGLSVGLLNGLTAQEYGVALDETGEKQDIQVAPLSNYLSSRLKQEFNEGNTIAGAMFSLVNRISADSAVEAFLPTEALTGGLDLLHYWDNKNYFAEAKVIGSHLQGSQDAILQKQLGPIHRFQRPDATYLELDSAREQLGGHGGLV